MRQERTHGPARGAGNGKDLDFKVELVPGYLNDAHLTEGIRSDDFIREANIKA